MINYFYKPSVFFLSQIQECFRGWSCLFIMHLKFSKLLLLWIWSFDHEKGNQWTTNKYSRIKSI